MGYTLYLYMNPNPHKSAHPRQAFSLAGLTGHYQALASSNWPLAGTNTSTLSHIQQELLLGKIPYQAIHIQLGIIFMWYNKIHSIQICSWSRTSQIAKFMGPTWGPPGSCRPQMGPMLAPRTLLSGMHQSLNSQIFPYLAPASKPEGVYCEDLGPNWQYELTWWIKLGRNAVFFFFVFFWGVCVWGCGGDGGGGGENMLIMVPRIHRNSKKWGCFGTK